MTVQDRISMPEDAKDEILQPKAIPRLQSGVELDAPNDKADINRAEFIRDPGLLQMWQH